MSHRAPIYMDHHATTPVDTAVFEQMVPYFTQKFGNAASVHHAFGDEAANAVDDARVQIANLLGATPRQVIFTSGATEANNIAIKGAMESAAGIMGANNPAHLIISAAEHKAVIDPAKWLRRRGFEVTVLEVDQFGMVSAESVADAIRESSTVLVSIMLANNEVGTINPIEAIGHECRTRGVMLHCDAAQGTACLPIDFAGWPVDLMSVSAHKAYGPKGIGALLVKRDVRRRIQPLFHGGGHEQSLRSGTLPVPLIVGFGAACDMAATLLVENAKQIGELRDRLWSGLQRRITGIHLNGHPTMRLFGNLNVSIDDVDGDRLLTLIHQVALSSGAACSTTDPEPSHVLKAMGCSDERAIASLRFGLGRCNTKDEVDFTISYLSDLVARSRDG
jgi:cysteine desulfurase